MSESEATCHKERAPEGPPLFENGNIQFRVYHVGWIISGFFAMVATVTSLWLINKHLQWYTNKREQRYIVRLLFMVPIYALISFASFLFWNQSTPLILIRDGYESTVLTSFFYLLLMYLSPDPEEQRAIFRKAGLSREADREALKKGEKCKKWVWPMGFVKWKPVDGLYFLQLQKWGVLQYCVIRPTTTLAAVILEYAGLYCESSWSPGWGHIYIIVIVSISVTIAMYCLIQLYVPVSEELAPHKPLLKLFAVKAVVFLTFWQATGLSFLASFGLIKDSEFMTAEDINIGIGALLETFEMMLFGFLHVKAFTYKPYRPFHDPKSSDPPPQRTKRLRALGHAMDFRETFRELWEGCVYLWDRMRGREPRPDIGARRMADYEQVHGRSRLPPAPTQASKGLSEATPKIKSANGEKDNLIRVEVEEQIDIDGRRDWLGRARRERSEGLEAQIERELASRGFGPDDTDDIPPPDRRQRSWWRNVYDRLSQSGDYESAPARVPSQRRPPRTKSRHRPSSRDQNDRRLLIHDEFDFDDPPPPSLIRNHRTQKTHSALGLSIPEEPEDQKAKPKRERRNRDGLPAPSRRDARPSSYGLPNNKPLGLPPQATRADSALGRMFPPSTNHTSANDHDGQTSPVSPSNDWLPVRAISPLQISLANVADASFGMAGLRNYPLTVPQGISSPTSLEGEIVHPSHPPQAPEVPPKTNSALHRRESAFHSEHPDGHNVPGSPQSDATFLTAASHHTIRAEDRRRRTSSPISPATSPQDYALPFQSTRSPEGVASSSRPPRHVPRPTTLTTPPPLAQPNYPLSNPAYIDPHRSIDKPSSSSNSPGHPQTYQYSRPVYTSRHQAGDNGLNRDPSARLHDSQAGSANRPATRRISQPYHGSTNSTYSPYPDPRMRHG